MQLSYMARLLCLAFFSMGIFAALLELGLWWALPLVTRALAHCDARWRERILFVAALSPHAMALFLTVAFLLPRYIQAEGNLYSERVGLVCIIAVGVVMAHALSALWRATATFFRTWSWKRKGRLLPQHVGGMPVICFEVSYPLLAVLGLWRPVIAISSVLPDQLSCSPEGVETALAHERSHARQYDNLKLLVLSCLPSVGFQRKKHPSLMRHWRFSAELAADIEAVRGDRGRGLLLAEILLAFATSTSASSLGESSMALLGQGDMLRERIEHLLSPETYTKRQFSLTSRVSLTFVLATLFVVAVMTLRFAGPLWHPLAESMLHLG